MYIDSLPHLLHNGDRVDNYLDVKYLGHIVAGDGSDEPDLNNRIALMTSTFNKYTHVWKSAELNTRVGGQSEHTNSEPSRPGHPGRSIQTSDRTGV